MVRVLAGRAHGLVPAPRHPGRPAPATPPREERAVALRTRHGRRRVPLPLGLGRAGGHRQPGRLRPDRARQGVGGVARLLRPADQRALRALRHRAGGRRDEDDDGLLARRPTARTRSGERRARCCACTGGSPPTRWRCSRCRRRTPSSRSPARCSHPSSPTSCATTTSPRASASRYRRQDEVGTPWCVTVDFDSLEDNAVTVRDRDTTEQVRVPIGDLVAELRRRSGED